MNNKYFYGVDFNKMHLYCKIKSLFIYHEIVKRYKINFNFDKEYLVIVDYRLDKTIDIIVDDLKGFKKTINLKYDEVEFNYFFENLEEQEKVFYDELPF